MTSEKRTVVGQFFDLEFALVPPIEVEPERCALVIIDMQYLEASADHGINLALEKIRPGSSAFYNRRVEEVTVPTIRKLLEYIR